MESNIIYGAIALAAILSGVLVAKRGSAADLVAAATGLIDPLKARLAELEGRVRELEPLVPRVAALELWGAYLEGEVVLLGGVPIPFDEFLKRVQRGDSAFPISD